MGTGLQYIVGILAIITDAVVVPCGAVDNRVEVVAAGAFPDHRLSFPFSDAAEIIFLDEQLGVTTFRQTRVYTAIERTGVGNGTWLFSVLITV